MGMFGLPKDPGRPNVFSLLDSSGQGVRFISNRSNPRLTQKFTDLI